MKRYIRSNDCGRYIDIAELIDHIDHIYVTSNDTAVFGATITDPDDDIDDINYLSWSDDQLESLTRSEIKKFTNLELLSRLRRIDPDKLSKQQLDSLDSAMKVKYKMGNRQKQNILDMLTRCPDITVQKQRYKNKNFLKQHQLSDEDVRTILKQLTINDFACKTRSVDADYSGNLLVIMKPKNVKLADGTEVDGAKMYIKIDISDIDQPDAIISFHD